MAAVWGGSSPRVGWRKGPRECDRILATLKAIMGHRLMQHSAGVEREHVVTRMVPRSLGRASADSVCGPCRSGRPWASPLLTQGSAEEERAELVE